MSHEIKQILNKVHVLYDKVQETSLDVATDTESLSLISRAALYATGALYVGGAVYIVYQFFKFVYTRSVYYGSFLFPPKEQDMFEATTSNSKTKSSSHKRSKQKKHRANRQVSQDESNEDEDDGLSDITNSTQGKSIKQLLKESKQAQGKSNGQAFDKGTQHACYVNTFKGHSDIVTGLSISNEGNVLVSCCEDRYLRFFSLNPSKLDQNPNIIKSNIFKQPLDVTFGKTYSDVAVLVQGESLYPDLVIYKLKQGNQLEEVKKIPQVHGKREVIQLLASSSESPVPYYITCSKDRDFHVISSTGTVIQSITVGAMVNHNVAISRDGKFIAVAGYTSDVKIWEVVLAQDKTSVAKVIKAMDLGGHKGQIMCVSFSPDNSQCVTIGKDGEIRIWNIRVRYQQQEDAKLAIKFKGLLEKPVYYHKVLFGYGFIVCIANDNSVQIYKTSDGSILTTIPKIHSKPVTSAQLLYKQIQDPTSKQKISIFATGSQDNQVRLWKVPAL